MGVLDDYDRSELFSTTQLSIKLSKMISVCLASYNGAKYIKKQLDSILRQLSGEDELIISDDGSTDGTLEIIKGYGDDRIILLHHLRPTCNAKHYRVNRYVTSNFENALMHCKGDYIFLADQDDIWADNKVQVMMDYAKSHPDKDLFLSSICVINEDDSIKKPKVTPHISTFVKGIIVAKYLGSSMMLTRRLLDCVLPFPKGIVSHDAWIGAMAAFKHRMAIVDKPLLLYRRHDKNVTSKEIYTPLYKKLGYRLVILFNVLRRR